MNWFDLFSGSGDAFRRRMSLASLGAMKYGKISDRISEGGGDWTKRGGKDSIVRHVPIIIEGDESDQENKNDKLRNVLIDNLSFSRYAHAWNIPDSVSSLFSLRSLSSQSSHEELSPLDKTEEVVKVWMMRNGETRTENQGEREYASTLPKVMAATPQTVLKRKPFSDISQVVKS